MLRVVIVFLALHAGVLDVLDGGRESVRGASLMHQLRQLPDRELLGELVEDAVLTALRWMLDADADALHRVTDVEESSGLAAPSIDGERLAHRRLHAETVEHRAPDDVVVEPRGQRSMERRLLGLAAVDHALVQIGRSQAPDATREVDVVTVMHLREVIEASRRLRVGEPVAPAVV